MTSDPPDPETPNTLKPLSADLSRFAHHLEGTSLSDAQKQDMLETLWALMIQFVDLGFGLSPTQNICGQLVEIADHLPSDSAKALHSSSPPDAFNNAAQDRSAPQKGR